MRASVLRRTPSRADRPMRAWGTLPGDDPERDRADKAAAIEAAGIDLDPPQPGAHRHGDAGHGSEHAHPHQHSGPGQSPIIGIVGAGAVGTALGLALSRAGWRTRSTTWSALRTSGSWPQC